MTITPEMGRGSRLPVIQPRAVDPEWECRNSGDCCTKPTGVTMTPIEKRIVELAASVAMPDRVLHWATSPDGRFVTLAAQPCPLYLPGVDGRGRCGIYSSRPYNCRRFACMRPDPNTEAWEEDEHGCRNLLDRLSQSRVARRAFALIQRRAQKWAVKNGWSNDAHQHSR